MPRRRSTCDVFAAAAERDRAAVAGECRFQGAERAAERAALRCRRCRPRARRGRRPTSSGFHRFFTARSLASTSDVRQVMHNRAAVCATVSRHENIRSASRALFAVPGAFRWSPLPAPKRIPTHEDIWLMKRVGAPQVSPDGRWIVVSVIEPSYDDNAQLSDLWLIDTSRAPFEPPPDLDAPAGERRDLESGQPPHRLQRAARQRRCSADLFARPGGGRRSAAPHQSLRRRTRAGVFARRPAAGVRVHHVSAARATTRPTRR